MKKANRSEQYKSLNARAGEDYISFVNSFDKVIEPFSDTALRALNAVSGGRILDGGCGLTSLLFVRAGAEVAGIDISDK